jgi:lysophospholipase L1-like esterase
MLMTASRLHGVLGLIVLAVASLPAAAEPIRVTTFGDSIMNGLNLYDDPAMTAWQQSQWETKDLYGDVFPGSGGGMQVAFNSRSISAVVRPRAYGGLSMVWAPATQTRAIGVDENLDWHYNYSVNPFDHMLASDPDVVFFMLGVNDAGGYAANGNDWGKPYRQYFAEQLDSMLDRLADTVNGRGRAPKVFVGTISPLRVPSAPGNWWGQSYTQAQIDERAAAAAQIDAINAVISAQAADHGFVLVDINAAIKAAGANWEQYYTDGVHPNFAGRELMRDAFLDAYEANPLPEPATMALLAAGAVAMLRRR